MRKVIKIILMLIIVFCSSNVFAKEMKIHVIDYGEEGKSGDCVLIEQNNNFLLMDVSIDTNSNNSVMKKLNELNVDTFDLYLSHYHGDHYGSHNPTQVITPTYIEQIMNNPRYKISKIYVPDPENNNNHSLGGVYVKDIFSRIEKTAKNRNIELVKLKMNSTFNIGEATAKVIYYKVTPNNENDSSLVTMISFENRKYLTAGDIGPNVEKEIINQNIDVKADIMKLSHHGVDDSNSSIFLNKVKPQYTFFQLGERTPETFINFERSKATLNRISKIANIYSMDFNGYTFFRILNGDISVFTSKHQRSITINYIDSENNQIIKTKTSRYNTGSLYYLFDDLNMSDYEYDQDKNKNTSLNGMIKDNISVNLYYKKIPSTMQSKDSSVLKISNDTIKIIPTKDYISYGELKGLISYTGTIFLKDNSNIDIFNDNEPIKTGYTLSSNKIYNIVLLGDVNRDGRISSQDYIMVRKHIMKSSNIISDIELMAADINDDGKISALDYTAIKKIIIQKQN